MAKEDINNKTIFVLAILVVLVVAGTTWLVLNKLNGIEVSKPQSVVIEKRIDYVQPDDGGKVSMEILPTPKAGGGE
ncbi:MAG: hypothetical protein ABIB71_04970 [Candidatus Woesearchaeota archaeon]